MSDQVQQGIPNARGVVVTGVGVLTPLGDNIDALFAALCDGRSAIAEIEGFDVAGLPYHQGGEIRGFDAAAYLDAKNLRPLDRTGRLAAVAASCALADAGWDDHARDSSNGNGTGGSQEIGLVLATLFGSVHTISEFDRRALTAGAMYVKPLDFANSVINAAAGQTAIWHHLPGVNSTLGGGPTAGLQAIGYAADLVASGRAEVVLAGGADELCYESYLGYAKAGVLCGSPWAHSDGMAHVEPARAVPFDKRRNGFAPAEGAAFLVLEEEEAARRRGARILARLHGHASTFDVSLGQDPSSSAHALARAVRLALAASQCNGRGGSGDPMHGEPIGADQIAAVSAAASGSRGDDRAEAEGLAQALGTHARSVPVTAIKSMLGEPMGAGGALQVAVLATALARETLPGIAGLAEVDDGLELGGLSAETRTLGNGHLRGGAPGSGPFGLATAVGLYGPAAAVVLESMAVQGSPTESTGDA